MRDVIQAGFFIAVDQKRKSFELLPAIVRWVDKEHAGCAFARPLSAYVLDHIARHSTTL